MRWLGPIAAALLVFACNSGDDDSIRADAAAAIDGAPADALAGGIDANAGGGVDADLDAIAASPCGLPVPTDVIDVSVGDLHQRIVDGDPLAVVDVREPSETASGIIENALLYPWSSGVLSADHEELPDDVPLFVICQSGSRSAVASQFLFTNGHQCVHNVLGGMTAWTGAGYPTVTP